METIKVNVDNQILQVEKGTNLFSCLRSSGLLDGLCYHPTLKSEHNCGLCLVEMEDEITGQKELISSCQKIILTPVKVHIQKSHVKSVRQSILSLWLHHFSNLKFIIPSPLSLKLSRFFKHTQPLQLNIQGDSDTKVSVKKWSPSLQYNVDLCIGCGLCVDFVWQTQNANILELQMKGGHFEVVKDGQLEARYEKSLSLSCPTNAIEHSLVNSFFSDVFPAHGAWDIFYLQENFLIICERNMVSVRPTEDNPFVSSSIYELILRYQPDLLFKSILHSNTHLATKKCAWYLGKGLPESTLETVSRVARRRREKILPLYADQEMQLQSHPLSTVKEDKAILILGPDDELSPEDFSRFKSVGMIALSRFNQWRGRPMSDYTDIIWAPLPDVFEFEGDERFVRHFSHVVKRLNL